MINDNMAITRRRVVGAVTAAGIDDYELAVEETGAFELDRRLPSDTGEPVQSDSIELELRFGLKQTTGS